MNLKWKLIGVLSCVVLSATPSDFIVVANSSLKVSRVSSDDLKGIFLGTKTSLADGIHVEPVLLRSGLAHRAFIKQYIGKTPATLANYYRSLVFTGRGTMPQMLASDAELVEYVARTKGAVGYVSGGANIENVKILEVK